MSRANKPPTINWTCRILGRLLNAVDSLTMWGVAEYRAKQFAPEFGLYIPPGLWYQMDPAIPGAPLVFSAPAPHHPLECVAGLRGLGEDTAKRFEDRYELVRGGTWLQWTERAAGVLGISPAQVRVLYQIVTPQHLNGGAPADWAGRSVEARIMMFRAAGLDEPERKAEAAAKDAIFKPGTGGPVRMQFWGTEVTGEVEL